MLGLAALSLAFTGPGALSLDALLGLPLAGARWGLAALAAGAIGGILPLDHPQARAARDAVHD